MRMAEVCYKQGNTEQAFEHITRVEELIKPQDKYLLFLIKGKCFDKNKEFEAAAAEYMKAKIVCEQYSLQPEVLGNIEFRLGWSLIRSRQNFDEGKAHLEKAAELLPNNSEVNIKLAGVLLQSQDKQTADDLNHIEILLKRALDIDPNSSEACLLLGKALQKSEKWEESI